MKKRKEIETLIEKQMIAWYQSETSGIKVHYLVTPINLADFIDTFFTIRKMPKKWKQVLKDSK